MPDRRISHARALLLASKAADGEVSMTESMSLARHLQECPDCAREAREMGDLYALLARTLRRKRRRK